MLSKEQLEMHMYFFNQGEKNSDFKNTKRYIEAKEYLKYILEKINEIKNNNESSKKEVELIEQISRTTNFLEKIKLDTIEDPIDDIFEYDDLVRDFLNEEELILLYTIIVKSNLKYRKEIEEKQVLEHEIIREDIISRNAINAANMIYQMKNKKNNNILTEEQQNVLKELEESTEKYQETLGESLQNKIRQETYENIYEGILKYSNDFETLKKYFSNSEYNEFLAYCINKMVANIKEVDNSEIPTEEKEQKIEVYFSNAVIFQKYLKEKEIEDLQELEQDEEKSNIGINKIIFYKSKYSDNHEIIDSIKFVKQDERPKLELLIEKILNNEIDHNKPSRKMYISYNDSSPYVLVCTRLFDNHILVYGVAKKGQKYKFDFSKEKKLTKIIRDNFHNPNESLEYTRVMNESLECMNSLIKQIRGRVM